VPSDVLEETECGFNLRNDSSDRRPKVPRIVRPTSLTGEAERLARVAASDAIHNSTPRPAVEGSQVAPDRCRSQGFLFHASRQDRGGESFPLNVTDDASRSACCKLKSEVKPADSGAEREHVEATTIHTVHLLHTGTSPTL
jgi:hypothetical protein